MSNHSNKKAENEVPTQPEDPIVSNNPPNSSQQNTESFLIDSPPPLMDPPEVLFDLSADLPDPLAGLSDPPAATTDPPATPTDSPAVRSSPTPEEEDPNTTEIRKSTSLPTFASITDHFLKLVESSDGFRKKLPKISFNFGEWFARRNSSLLKENQNLDDSAEGSPDEIQETEQEEPEPDERLEGPSVTTIYKGNSLDVAGVDSLISVVSEHTHYPAPQGETEWDRTLRRLSRVAASDDKFRARNVDVRSNSTSSESSGESSVTSATSLSFRNTPAGAVHIGAPLPRSPYSTKPSLHKASKIYVAPDSPFSYTYRPFRKPKKADVIRDPMLISDNNEWPQQYPYTFSQVNVGTKDWVNIPHGSDMYIACRQWNFPEPVPDNVPVPPEVDPLVRYRLERKGIGGDQLKAIDQYELLKIQKEIELGMSISGRKLNGYCSSEGEECAFTRVHCKDDPNFDLLHHLDIGEEGKWPDPYYFYWDWKQTERDVDENYQRHITRKTQRKLKIMEELEGDIMRIPYYRIAAHDTDASDPEDPKGPHVTDPGNPFSLRWRFNEVREAVTDPIERRYPYLYLYLQGKYYNKYYKLKKAHRARKRQWYAAYHKLISKNVNPNCFDKCYANCCLIGHQWRSYPLWYTVWKGCVRPIVKRIPRKFKFLNAKRTQTIFYGTMASLYGTQYIAEHDVLPNMDNPVLTSEIALKKAMEIKQKFLTFNTETGSSHVDYLKMLKSRKYEKYLDYIGLLCRYQPIKMPNRVRKVFFLNYFNVLSIQTQIWRIPEVENMKYLWEMPNFWEKTKGLCGFVELSLEEIYHGILRCNKPHPIKQAQVFKEKKTKGFPRESSLTRLSLDWLDPRIHFALNIGCKGCPPIHIFSLYEQDCQLDEVAKTYIRSRVKIDVDLRLVRLPILFLWYEKDFGCDERVMLWYIKRFMLARDLLKVRKLVTSKRAIFFQYERFDDTLDHTVRRHPATTCPDLICRKIIPVYWGSRF